MDAETPATGHARPARALLSMPLLAVGAVLVLVLVACTPVGDEPVSSVPGTTATTVTTIASETSTTLKQTTTTSAISPVAPMLAATGDHRTTTLFTVGESIGGYTPIGRLDGIGAFPSTDNTVRLLVNHEASAGTGAPYQLANGLSLTGARIDFFDVSMQSLGVVGSGLGYHTIHDRTGSEVTSAAQVNETGDPSAGLDRFCSAQFITAGTYGFIDAIYLTGEESKITKHPHGGSVWALDVGNETLWAARELGRGVWENLTPIETGDPSTVALLMGDDKMPAPLYLWVGNLHTEATGSEGFVLRNGLSDGTLHVWVPDNPDVTDHAEFSGTGATMPGRFLPIAVAETAMAGEDGYDDAGYKDEDTLKEDAFNELGAFRFARPEDVATNPANGTQAVFAVTGSDEGTDLWGGLYIVDIDFATSDAPSATIRILLDANDTGDESVRNPDNLDWADDGFIYVQEDKANSVFGAESSRDASVYQVNPENGTVATIAEMDRSIISPAGADDAAENTLGSWESSGVLDVSHLFGAESGETLLIATVQAHSIVLGEIGELDLVEGGQLVWITVGG